MAKLTAQLLAEHQSIPFIARNQRRFLVVKKLPSSRYYLEVRDENNLFHETHEVVHFNVVLWLLKQLYLIEGADTSENWVSLDDWIHGPTMRVPFLHPDPAEQ